MPIKIREFLRKFGGLFFENQMKSFGSIFSGSFMLAFLLFAASVSSCTKEKQEDEPKPKVQLEVPSPKLESVGSITALLSWHPVQGAVSYNVYFKDDEYPEISIDTFILIKGLAPLTDYSIAVSAVPASQSSYVESEKSSSVSFKTLQKQKLDSPEINVSNITPTGFESCWSGIAEAGSYTLILSDKALIQSDTLSVEGDTVKTWSGLVPDTDYILQVIAVPSDDFKEFLDSSEPSVKEVTTHAADPLDTPVLTVERASCYVSTVSWKKEPQASMFEWKLDDGEVNQTTDLSVSFENLEKDSHHMLSVRAISADTKVASDSDWAKVEFDAIDDFSSSLRLSNAVVSGDNATFTASVTSGEEFYMGFAPKAKYLKLDGQVDSTAIMIEVLDTLSAKADKLVEAGTYPTRREALSSLVRNKSTRLTSSALYHSASYLCYAFDVNTYDCTAHSELKFLEVTTGEHIAAQGGYNSSTLMNLSSTLAYGYSSSAGVYDDTNYVGFSIYTDSGNVTCTEVKYTILTLSAYNSAIGTSFDESVSDAVKTYFDNNGTTMSDANLTKLNAGTAYSSGYSKRTANATYVFMSRAITESCDTLTSVSAIRTCSNVCNWLDIKGETPGKFTVKSNLPIISGKYSCATLTSANNTPELIKEYISDKGTELTDAKIASINGDGLQINYSSLSSGKTYTLIVQVTSITGETITRCCPLRVE